MSGSVHLHRNHGRRLAAAAFGCVTILALAAGPTFAHVSKAAGSVPMNAFELTARLNLLRAEEFGADPAEQAELQVLEDEALGDDANQSGDQGQTGQQDQPDATNSDQGGQPDATNSDQGDQQNVDEGDQGQQDQPDATDGHHGQSGDSGQSGDHSGDSQDNGGDGGDGGTGGDGGGNSGGANGG